MGYLRLYDYDKSVQTKILNEVTGNNDVRRQLAELPVLAEIKSKLSQKYDLSNEFTNTLPYSYTAIYKAGQRIELNFPAFSATSTYALNSLVVNNGLAYRCTTAVTVSGSFNIANWTILGNQYDMFYAQYPKPVFDLNTVYAVGDQVFWKDKVYTCATPTVVLSHDDLLQEGYSMNEMNAIRNVFPDDVQNGTVYWGTGTPYSIPANTLPTNTTYWTLGDNRNQQLVEMAVYMSYYRLCSRISPQNVSEAAYYNNEYARKTLIEAANGIITFDLPTIQPTTGRRIRFGSNQKNINTY